MKRLLCSYSLVIAGLLVGSCGAFPKSAGMRGEQTIQLSYVDWGY